MADDPTIDIEGIDESADEALQYLDQLEQTEQARETVVAQEMQADAQATAEQNDPREADQWGFKALAK